MIETSETDEHVLFCDELDGVCEMIIWLELHQKSHTSSWWCGASFHTPTSGHYLWMWFCRAGMFLRTGILLQSFYGNVILIILMIGIMIGVITMIRKVTGEMNNNFYLTLSL